jgi:hypothetical protein
MLTHVLPTIQLPLGIEYLSIIQSCRPPVRAVPRDEFVVKKAYLKRYPALRYVAFSVNGYLYQVDPSTGAPVKKSKTMDDWRQPTLSEYANQSCCV